MACQRVMTLFGHWQSFEAGSANLIGLGATIWSVCYVPGPALMPRGSSQSHLASYKTDSESSIIVHSDPASKKQSPSFNLICLILGPML